MDVSILGNFSSMTTKSPRKVFIEITHELNEILEEVIVQTASIPKFHIDLSKSSNDITVDVMHARKFGRCYSIQIANEIVNQGISEIEFLSKMNTYIYFHHPGQWLSSDQKAKLYTTIGHNHFMDMTYSIMENTLKHDSPIPCDDETNLEYDRCFNNAIYRVSNSYFGQI